MAIEFSEPGKVEFTMFEYIQVEVEEDQSTNTSKLNEYIMNEQVI